METVSVVITAYNIEKYIEECVRSIMNQTLKDIKIICVDDCSTDNTVNILRNIQKEDDRIELLIQKNNKGLASSRLNGYERAKGKYVYIMDGDDMLVPDALERMYRVAEDNDLDILSFSGQSFYEDEETLQKFSDKRNIYRREGKYFDEAVSGIALFAEYMKNYDMCGNMVFQFFRREYVTKKEIIAIDGIRFGESPLALYLTAQRAMCIPDQLYLRRFRAGSDVTTSMNRIKIESMIIQYDFDYSFYQPYAARYKEYSEWILSFLYCRFKMIVLGFRDVSFDISEAELLSSFPTAEYLFENVIRYIDDKNLFCEQINLRVLQKLKAEKNIIIYGNGKVSSYLISKLEDFGIHDYMIATSMGESKNNGKCRVYRIDELCDYRETSLVLIAVTYVNKRAVYNTLKEKGFKRIMEISRG